MVQRHLLHTAATLPSGAVSGLTSERVRRVPAHCGQGGRRACVPIARPLPAAPRELDAVHGRALAHGRPRRAQIKRSAVLSSQDRCIRSSDTPLDPSEGARRARGLRGVAAIMDGPGFGGDYVPDIVKQFVHYLYRHIRCVRRVGVQGAGERATAGRARASAPRCCALPAALLRRASVNEAPAGIGHRGTDGCAPALLHAQGAQHSRDPVYV